MNDLAVVETAGPEGVIDRDTEITPPPPLPSNPPLERDESDQEEQQAAQVVGPDDMPFDEAPFPLVYNEAKAALERCDRIDGCKYWTSEALRMASYARQMRDPSFMTMSKRIRLRALRRAGILLSQLKAGKTGPKANSVGDHPPNSGRFAAARAAGMSRDQTIMALRIAEVPEAEFEEAVEEGISAAELEKRCQRMSARARAWWDGRQAREHSARWAAGFREEMQQRHIAAAANARAEFVALLADNRLSAAARLPAAARLLDAIVRLGISEAQALVHDVEAAAAEIKEEDARQLRLSLQEQQPASEEDAPSGEAA